MNYWLHRREVLIVTLRDLNNSIELPDPLTPTHLRIVQEAIRILTDYNGGFQEFLPDEDWELVVDFYLGANGKRL